MGSNASAVLLDPAGTAGRAYSAMTTPHMYVIDPTGKLVYMGGIDDIPTPREADLARAKQLVDLALEEATAGRPVTTPTSRPYGCNVKYRGDAHRSRCGEHGPADPEWPRFPPCSWCWQHRRQPGSLRRRVLRRR